MLSGPLWILKTAYIAIKNTTLTYLWGDFDCCQSQVGPIAKEGCVAGPGCRARGPVSQVDPIMQEPDKSIWKPQQENCSI